MAFPLLIFTDLDGTLLDHHTYSFRAAGATLQRLGELSIPLILVSSKTRVEIKRLQEKLGLNEPFISENGGGIFFPPEHGGQIPDGCEHFNGYRGIIFGKPYQYIRKIFVLFRDAYQIKGFGDMAVEEIIQATGLGREEAILAAQRDFSEPFLFLSQPRPRELDEEISAYGLTVTRGGRFYHLLGAGQDKGRAVAETTRLYRTGGRKDIVTVALGDAQNDEAMLKTVDIPVLVPGPDGSYEAMQIPGLRRAPYPGSRGWGMVVGELLDEMGRKRSGIAAGETACEP